MHSFIPLKMFISFTWNKSEEAWLLPTKSCQISLITCRFVFEVQWRVLNESLELQLYSLTLWSVSFPLDSPTDSEPWVFYRGAEYLLVQQPFDWDSVSLACQMMGAYLLAIHSREELHFVKEHMRRVCLSHFNIVYPVFNYSNKLCCRNNND